MGSSPNHVSDGGGKRRRVDGSVAEILNDGLVPARAEAVVTNGGDGAPAGRRTHAKSRSGCRVCKTRKIKVSFGVSVRLATIHGHAC